MTNIGRVFLVGCPRSGTTLVQSMLAAHPGVHTLPETHFFSRIIPNAKWARRLGVTDKKVRDFLKGKLRETAGDTVTVPTGFRTLFVATYGQAFVRYLDGECVRNSKAVWVEKTPQHLHRIEAIQNSAPDAKFIHILRDGKDTVASLYHVAREYPDRWGGEQPIEDCTARWIRDISVSRSYRDNPSHHFLVYDELTADPEPTLQNLCRFINIEYDAGMIVDSSVAYRQNVAEQDAEWTGNAGQPLYQHKDGGKFQTYLSDEQRSVAQTAINSAGYTHLRDTFLSEHR